MPIIIFLFALCFTSVAAAQTGAFQKSITDNGRSLTLYYYVPDTYKEEQNYPLIVAMPLGGNSGYDIRTRLLPAAREIGAVLVCPDHNSMDSAIVAAGYAHARGSYSIDSSRIIICGYSLGGMSAFQFAAGNSSIVSGYIGIAPAVYEFSLSPEIAAQLPIALIAGSLDDMKSYCLDLIEYYSNNGGRWKYIEKPGVDHMGDYYSSQEFTLDWLACYDFICEDISVKQKALVNEQMTVCPNPACSAIQISWAAPGAVSLSLHRWDGLKVADYWIHDKQNITVNTTALACGHYFAALRLKDGSLVIHPVLVLR